MKKFLYLIQARSTSALKHLSLQSERSDVLIYTFDKKIDHPNFIYKPNTWWHEGRNILIEVAKKLPVRYEYYILLDDDIEFKKGSFEEYENLVLKVNPHISMPAYPKKSRIKRHHKLTPFRYSDFVDYDCLYVCLARELFCDCRLLPYYTGYDELKDFYKSFYSAELFWGNIFEHHLDKRRVVFNEIVIDDTSANYSYNPNYHYSKLLKKLKKDNKDFSNNIASVMPLRGISQSIHTIQNTRERLLNIKDKKIKKYSINKHSIPYILKFWKFKLFSSIIKKVYRIFIPWYKALHLWRDLILNISIKIKSR